MAASHIERHFVTFDNRQIHYRRAGSGPPVLLLHPSMRSSAIYISLIEKLAEHFTVIAMDSPGYGLSDHVHMLKPEIPDFADGVIQFLDALGIDKVGLYGQLTAAKIALDLACRYPERFTVVVLDKYLMHTEDERRDVLLNFAPEFKPVWDGRHMLHAWTFVREHAHSYPWHRQTAATRIDVDMPDADGLYFGVMNFFRTGLFYHLGPRAAFRYIGQPRVHQIKARTFFLGTRLKPFDTHLERLPALPAHVTAEMVEDEAQFESRLMDILSAFPSSAPVPAAPAPAPLAHRCVSTYLEGGGGLIHVRHNPHGSGRPLLLVHGAGSAARVGERLADSLMGKRPFIGIDFPGHGESDPLADIETDTVAAYADSLAQAVDRLNLTQVDVLALEGGGCAALELAALKPGLIKRLALCDILCPGAEEHDEFRTRYAPTITPDEHGGYLLQAWHFIRDQYLFWPWFDKRKENFLWEPPYAELEFVHAKVVELLKSLTSFQSFYHSHFDYPFEERLRGSAAPLSVYTFPHDPKRAHAERAAAAAGVELRRLGREMNAWAEEIHAPR